MSFCMINAMKPRSVVRCALFLGCLLGLGTSALTQDFPGVNAEPAGSAAGPAANREPVILSTEWSSDGVAPGDQIILAVVHDIAEPWHIQVRKPALDWLIPTEVRVVEPPEGVLFGDVQYPDPHPIEIDFGEGPQTLDFYTGTAPVFFKVSVGPSVAPGEYPVRLTSTWQACDDRSCLPPETTELTATLRVTAPGVSGTPSNEALFADYGKAGGASPEVLRIPFFGLDFEIDPTRFGLLWLVAAIGGFLLNLTPCVLPLIPIKILGLNQAAGNRSRMLMLGWVMAAGVVVFWLALGVAISAVSGFTATNQLFQYPAFTIGVGVIIAVMAIGMCGMFTVQLPRAIYMFNPSQETVVGSFLFGIMTAVLSTPCTAPFMGAAAAWAATQPAAVTLSTFAAIGAGMAAPYLILATFPALIHRMPRSGPASDLIKQVMGLLMLAAAMYFLGTGLSGLMVDPPDPPSRAYWWAVSAFLAAAGAWLAFRTFKITAAGGKRILFGGLGALLVLAGALIGNRFSDRGPIEWVYYTPERFAAAANGDQIIVLEFTAEWCLNCHALEQAVLHSADVVAALNSERVTPIKVDLTGNNAPGNEKLLEVGRRTIPLLVVYGPGGAELFKSDAYTVRQVLEAIQAGTASE